MNETSINLLWTKIPKIFEKLPGPGLLLITGNENENNIMTIGWLEFGVIWKEPVASVLVRPSRHTFKLIEKYNEFTINLVSSDYNDAINICGAKSGSYCNKFQEANLQIKNSEKISCPSLKEALITIECSTVYKQEMNPKNLNDLLIARHYANNDFHTIYTGKIVNFTSII